MTMEKVYSTYERYWHWLQALTIVLLSVTGFVIHFPAAQSLLKFELAIRIHEALAILTIANGFLSLFYHLTTGAIRQFVPEPKDIVSMAYKQGRYYLVGIFRGEPHPFVHGPNAKLNLLQQVTYLAILNLLLPIQIVTGVLLWKSHALPNYIVSIGGVSVLGGLHVAAAWLFVAFVVMHIYLTTTGRTPFEHILTMITGYGPESREHRVSSSAPAAPLDAITTLTESNSAKGKHGYE